MTWLHGHKQQAHICWNQRHERTWSQKCTRFQISAKLWQAKNWVKCQISHVLSKFRLLGWFMWPPISQYNLPSWVYPNLKFHSNIIHIFILFFCSHTFSCYSWCTDQPWNQFCTAYFGRDYYRQNTVSLKVRKNFIRSQDGINTEILSCVNSGSVWFSSFHSS